ncbi:hypothetical protein [Pseudonocardia sediminis]|nr:hypothetical protein [Pseudonocardia sediminis]
MHVRDLAGAHLGRNVEVWSETGSEPQWRISGKLVGVSHQRLSEDGEVSSELHFLTMADEDPSFVTLPPSGHARVFDL